VLVCFMKALARTLSQMPEILRTGSGTLYLIGITKGEVGYERRD
jgi:hypothetical protein